MLPTFSENGCALSWDITIQVSLRDPPCRERREDIFKFISLSHIGYTKFSVEINFTSILNYRFRTKQFDCALR